jgi:uncharacterized protein
VNHSIHPLRINLGFLINQPPGFQRDIPFDFEQYDLDEDFQVQDLRGSINLSRTQNGVRSLGEVSAKLSLDCGRCLDTFPQWLQSEFEEIFTYSNHPLSEDETIIPDDGNIDFEPIIREYLLLEIPYSPVCRPDCKGLCIVCGENLNENACGHTQTTLIEEESSNAIKGSHQSS